MKKGLVNIAQGTPETRDRLRFFLEFQKQKHPDKKLKTLSNAVDFALDRVIKLENENEDLKKKIKELEESVFELSSDLTNIKLGRSTLREFRENMERVGDGKVTIGFKDGKEVKDVD